MINAVQIVLTASITLLSGVLLLVVSEIIKNLIIAPLLKLRGSIGEVAYYLVYYANYLRNCSAPRNDTFLEAKAKCRELASRLRAESATIITTRFWLASTWSLLERKLLKLRGS